MSCSNFLKLSPLKSVLFGCCLIVAFGREAQAQTTINLPGQIKVTIPNLTSPAVKKPTTQQTPTSRPAGPLPVTSEEIKKIPAILPTDVDPRRVQGYADVRQALVKSPRPLQLILRLSNYSLTNDQAIKPVPTPTPVNLRVSLLEVAQQRMQRLLLAQKVAYQRPLRRLPMFAVTITPDQLDNLAKSGMISAVAVDLPGSYSLSYSVPASGAGDLAAIGQTVPLPRENTCRTGGCQPYVPSGNQRAIAILDTGVQAEHPFMSFNSVRSPLDRKIIDEACFSSSNPAAGLTSMCPDGATFLDTLGSGKPCVGYGICGHGTFVAGIAAGTNRRQALQAGVPEQGFSGIASEAYIVAIQTATLVQSSDQITIAPMTSSLLEALQYLINRTYALRADHQLIDLPPDYIGIDGTFAGEHPSGIQKYPLNLASVNISASVAGNCSNLNSFPSNDFRSLVNILKNERSRGVITVAASGNDNLRNRIAFPACMDNVVSVGGTFTPSAINKPSYGNVVEGAVADYKYGSNTSKNLTILAPGYDIKSSWPISPSQIASIQTTFDPSKGYGTGGGTSFAAPHVAGAIGILRELADECYLDERCTKKSADDIVNALKINGTPTEVPGTIPEQLINRLDVLRAAAWLFQSN